VGTRRGTGTSAPRLSAVEAGDWIIMVLGRGVRER
jgi:hypothetical protein